MKQMIFLTVLLTAFCFPVFAQSSKLVGEYKSSASVNSGLEKFLTELAKNPANYGLIKIQARTKQEGFKQVLKIRKWFNFRCMPLDRLSYAIIFGRDAKRKNTTQYWTTSNQSVIPDCDACMNINTSNLAGIEKLFD
jgi:hypothetical protein